MASETTVKDSVSQAIVYLFEKEMFYAEIIGSMKRVLGNKVPVAGVCIKDSIELHINPETFCKYSIPERAAILKHECEHILREHIFRMRELMPDVYSEGKKELAQDIINSQKHKVAIIAADCAVNSGLTQLPENCIHAEQFGLKDHETLEWYLEQLKDNKKMQQTNEFDDHSIWNESEGAKEILKEKVGQAVQQAANKARAAGRMTAENELAVSAFNKPSINWREQLKRFVARSIETSVESSKKKRNRRYGIMFPGEVKIEDLHIGVAIDTSGSVSDESIKQFMSEIGNIAKYAKVTVVEADSDIKNHYEFKPNKTYNVKGRGGTAYQPAFDWFTKNTQIDALIYFGDMDSSDQPTKPKFPVLWAIVGTQ